MVFTELGPLEECGSGINVEGAPLGFNPVEVWPPSIWFGEKGNKQKYAKREKENLKRMICHYRCSHYKTYKCKCTLIIEVEGTTVRHILKGVHEKACTQDNSIGVYFEEQVANGESLKTNYEREVRERVIFLALNELTLAPLRCYEKAIEDVLKGADTDAVRVPCSRAVSVFSRQYFYNSGI